jgi:transketolase
MNQRDAFWGTVYDNAIHDKDIIVLSADMGAPTLDKFRENLPSQFINVGIAEQNAISIASGLAKEGKTVFVYAIAPFIVFRCLEQIRVNQGIMNIPINIVGVGCGFGYEDSGATHHLVEDISIMRVIPNITIHSITDNIMASSVAELCCTSRFPRYIRLDRLPTGDVYDYPESFQNGLSILRKGDNCLVTTGSMVQVCLRVAKALDCGLIDIYRIPINSQNLCDALEGISKIITVEEHFLDGGFGSAVLEIVNETYLNYIPVTRIGLKKRYCFDYGGRDEIRKYHGIDEANLLKRVKALL